MRVLASIFVAALMVATAASAELIASSGGDLSTKWSVPNAVGGRSLLTGNSELVVVSSGAAISAYNASSLGNLEWSVPVTAGYTVSTLKVDELTNTVFAYSSSTNTSLPALLYSYALKDGSTVWSKEFAQSLQLIEHTSTNLITGVSNISSSGEEYITMTNHKLSNGELVWSKKMTHPVVLGAGVGDAVLGVLAYTPSRGMFVNFMYDLATGDYLCHGSSPISSMVMAGGLFAGYNELYNATTCVKEVTFPAVGVKVTVNGNHLYSLNENTNQLTCYSNGAAWTTPVATNGFQGFLAVSNIASNPDVVIANNQGSFTAINKTSGAALWNTTKFVPFGPKNTADQQVFPLGPETLFVPSLQGYVVLDTKNGGSVLEVNEHSPMTATLSFKAEKPFVVYGDLVSGSLKAVELKA